MIDFACRVSVQLNNLKGTFFVHVCHADTYICFGIIQLICIGGAELIAEVKIHSFMSVGVARW